MSKTNSKEKSLLAAIQRKAPSNSEASAASAPQIEEAAPPSRKAPKRSSGAPVQPAKSRVGKPVQFWLHDEDRRLVRELSAWLAGQGERPTDSLVIRSALRMATAGGDLLNAYRQASQLDGRLKQHKVA